MAGTLIGLKAEDPMDSILHRAVTVGTVSTLVAQASQERRVLMLVNDSNTTLYITYNCPAQMNFGLRLERDGGTLVMKGCCHFSVYAISANAGKRLLVTEGY